MVNFANSVLYALLATAASAELRHDRRHHHHRRKAPCTTDTLGASSTAAPYAMSNSTTLAGPTGTGNSLTTTVSATSTLVSTVTVIPVPVSTDAGASPSGGSPSGPGGSGSGSGGSGSGSSSSAAPGSGGSGGSGSGAGSGQCAPQTVTVTAQNTVTVTAGAGGAPDTSSSAPAVSSEAAPTPSASAPATSEVPSSSSAAATPVQPSSSAQPVESPSTSAEAAPTATPTGAPPKESPSTPVAGTSTSAAASGSSSASSPSGPPAGGKCGIAYDGNGQVSGSSPFSGSNTPWAFNWNPSSGDLAEGIEFVPSLQKPEWTASLVAALPEATGAKYIKSINEPDMTVAAGGTAMTPGDAVALYTGTLNQLAGSYKIGTPSVTSYNTTSGLAGFASGMVWLQQFHEACAGNCEIGFVDAHWYATGSGDESGSAEKQAEHFMDYVNQVIADSQALYGSDVEVWITEFSAFPKADSDPQINIDFLNIVIPQLEKSGITRYAYYMAQLLESGSSLNSVGSALMKLAAGGS